MAAEQQNEHLESNINAIGDERLSLQKKFDQVNESGRTFTAASEQDKKRLFLAYQSAKNDLYDKLNELLFVQKAYKEIIDVIECNNFMTHAVSMLLTRAYCGLGDFQTAHTIENILFSDSQSPKVITFKESYWWLKYIICRKVGDILGAEFYRNKFDSTATLFFNAPLDDQLKRFLAPPNTYVTLSSVMLLNKNGSPIDNSSFFSGFHVSSPGGFNNDESTERMKGLDCRSSEYKSWRFGIGYRAKRSRQEEGPAETPLDLIIGQGISKGLLVLTGPLTTQIMQADADLISLLRAEFQYVVEPDPVFERLFNESDREFHEQIGLTHDVLVSPTLHRYQRVMASVAKKDEALKLIKQFLQAPLLHKEVLFCGHGRNDGDWYFDDFLTFDELLLVIEERWEPCHIVANSCYSKQWADRWASEILTKFSSPESCPVRITAISDRLDEQGILPAMFHYVKDPRICAVLEVYKDLVTNDSLERSGDRQPDDPKALLSLANEIRDLMCQTIFSDSPFPLGFESNNHYNAFALSLLTNARNIVEDNNGSSDDLALYIQGSAVNGFSWTTKTNRPSRLFNKDSDYDVGIVSESLYNLSKECKHKVGRPMEIAKWEASTTPFEMSMFQLLSSAKSLCTNQVEILLFKSEEAAKDHTGCSIKTTFDDFDNANTCSVTIGTKYTFANREV